MEIINKYWCLVVLLFFGLVVNENVVQWILAVQVGGHTVGSGFEEAFESFSILGYLFVTAFRLIPYVGLGILIVIVSKTRFYENVLPVFFGGLIGILAIIVWGSWEALLPLYTEEQVSSTTAISFIFIPIYAIPAGAAGAAVLAAVYTPFRMVTRRKEAENSELNS